MQSFICGFTLQFRVNYVQTFFFQLMKWTHVSAFVIFLVKKNHSMIIYVLCVDPQAAVYVLSFTVNKRFGRGDDEISFFIKFAADFFDKPKIK